MAPLVVRAVNEHDSQLFDESFANLLEVIQDLSLDLTGSRLTLDAGFDSEENRRLIENAGMVPVIKPNLRNTKDQETINQRLEEFKEVEEVYKERHQGGKKLCLGRQVSEAGDTVRETSGHLYGI